MKPRFALELSNEAVSLIERQADGWAVLGTVDPEDQRLDRKLALLRSKAEAAAPEGFFTKLILPNSQILYLTVTAPGPDAQTRRSQIRKGLEGRTPYPADDLVFDWSGSGPEVRVAVVARVTLDEAQDFAEAYGFRPVAFVAAPDEGRFAGEPFFGQTIMAARHLPVGQRYDRDQDPVRLASAMADAGAADEPEAEAEDPPAPVEEAPFVEVELSDEAPAEIEAQGDDLAPEPDETGEATGAEPADISLTEESELMPAPAAEAAPEAEPAEPEDEPEAIAVEMAPVVDEAPFVELIEDAPEDMPEEAPETAPDSAAEMADDAATPPDDDGRIAAPLVTAAGISEVAEPVPPPVAEEPPTAPVSAFQSRRSQGPSVEMPEESRLAGLASRIGPVGAQRPMTETAPPEALPRTTEQTAPRAPVREVRQVRGIGLRVAAAAALIVAALGLWSLWPAGNAPTTDETVSEAAAPAATALSPTAPPAPAPAPAPQATPPADSNAVATEEPVPDLAQPAVAGSAPTTMALAEPDAAATEPPAAGADLAPDGLTEEPALAGGPALDAPPPSQPLPQPFGTTFTYDSDGQIAPTAEGVITPGGFTLILGKPGAAPPRRPATVAAAALAAAAAATLPPVNEKPSVRRPAARSAKLAAAAAAAPPVAAISAKAPEPRPAKIAEVARQTEENAARIADAAAAAAAAEARAAGVDDASVQAALAEAQAQPEAAPEPAPAPQAKPAEPPPEEVDEPELQGGIANMPTTRTVAKKSTFANAIDLGSINLIGVYGTSSNRRALVRLSSGRYVKVQVGDRLDGGQVAAIGDNVLSYVKKGRTITLKLAKDS